MSTANRRVATYLPKEIDDRFKEFIAERNLKGDSQALIVILSEFLGVSHQLGQRVGYSSNFATIDQVEALEAKLSQLLTQPDKPSKSLSESSLLGKLLSKLETLTRRVEVLEGTVWSRSLSDLEQDSLDVQVPGQLDLLLSESELPDDSESELPDDSESELELGKTSGLLDELPSNSLSSVLAETFDELQPLSDESLSQRFGVKKKTISNMKADPEKFIQWTKRKDPEGIAWNYRSDTKLYHPIS